ncbi:MAG: hypothetical protein WD651_09370 [Acidimicrobiia bacterium]
MRQAVADNRHQLKTLLETGWRTGPWWPLGYAWVLFGTFVGL